MEKSTENSIKQAAKKVFLQKGFAGARMQEIADEAGINKALLHYYYRSKQKLFEVIFEEVISVMLPRLNEIILENASVPEKLEHFIHAYIEGISTFPHVPLFVMHELSQNPDQFVEKIKHRDDLPDLLAFLTQINEEVQQGKIKPINPMQLLMNVVSMCAFPFVARPMIKELARIDDDDFMLLMQERKKVVSRFVLDALRP